MAATSENSGRVTIHPWVSYALILLIGIGSLALLLDESKLGEEAPKNPALAKVRSFVERNPDVEISRSLEQILGRSWLADTREQHQLRREQGGIADLSYRLRQKTQNRFDKLQREAFVSLKDLPSWRFGVTGGETPPQNYLLHLGVHETMQALVVSMLFLLLAAITLEGAWGTALFGGLVALVPLLSAGSYRLLYGNTGAPWIGASMLVAVLLGAYFVRSWRDFVVPGWALLPAWLVAEHLFARDFSLTYFDLGPLSLHGVGIGFGAVYALVVGLSGLEDKLQPAAKETAALVSNPVLDAAHEARECGDLDRACELLERELHRDSGNRDIAIALWELARRTDRARRATPAILASIATSLRQGNRQDAVSLWISLVLEVREPKADNTLLVRIGEALLGEGDSDPALHAFALAVDGPKQLSSILALRVVRAIGERDPGLVGKAAALALMDDQLDPSERASLQALASNAGDGVTSDRFVRDRRHLEQPVFPDKDRRVAADSNAPATAETRSASAPEARVPDAPAPRVDSPADAEAADPFQDPHAISADTFEDTSDAELSDPESWNQVGNVDDLSAELDDEGGFDWNGLDDDPEGYGAVDLSAETPPSETPSSGSMAGFDDTDTEVTETLEADDGISGLGQGPFSSDDLDGLEADDPLASSDPLAELSEFSDPGGPDAIAPRVRALQIRASVPLQCGAEGLSIEVEGGTKTMLPFERIEALAAGAVHGLSEKPVLVVDLALNWFAAGDDRVKIVRLRSDAFDPRALMPGEASALDALRALLRLLLERSGAIPLPGRDAACGSPFATFESLDDYQRDTFGA